MTEANLHYMNLQGAATIKTQAYRDVYRALEIAIELAAMRRIISDAGLGKSFCTETILRELGVTYVKVVATASPTPLRTGQKIAFALGGNPSGDRFQVEDLCVELLQGGIVLVVDDAHVLPPLSIDLLRSLHDEPGTFFTLIFAGDHKFERRLDADLQLKSRCRPTYLDPIELDEVPETLRRFHPLFDTVTDPGLLNKIRDDSVGGNLREWAVFARHAQIVMRKWGVDRLDEKVVDAVIYVMGSQN